MAYRHHRPRLPRPPFAESLEPRRLVSATPHRVRDINPGDGYLPYHVNQLAAHAGKLYFAADDGVSGVEPWVSDGTESGTFRLLDANPGPAGGYPVAFTPFKGAVYFAADGGGDTGFALWKTDGTEAGTVLVKDVADAAAGAGSVANLCVVGDTLFFTADDAMHGAELWASDGTTASTRLLKDVYPGPNPSTQNQLTPFGGALYFVAQDLAGRELWRSDGTEDGTYRVTDLLPGEGVGVLNLAAGPGMLLLSGQGSLTAGFEPWASDGTAAGTRLLRDLNPSGSSSPSQFTVVGRKAMFTANDGTNGVELWKTDGTPAGTVIVKNIRLAGSSNPGLFRAIDDRLWFVAADATHGREVWTSDGTAAGTTMLFDIAPGGTSSSPFFFVYQDGLVYFTANDDVTGHELWQSDGTAAGTVRISDIWPGLGSSAPSNLTVVNGHLLFGAGDPDTGNELWRLPDEIAPRVEAAAFDVQAGHVVRIRFSEDVSATLAADDLLVTPAAGGPAVPAAAVAFDPAARTARFSFAPTLPDGNYTAALPAGAVADPSGHALAAGATLDFFVLAGDANRDRSVNIGDFSILASRFNQPGTFSQGDFDYSGTTDIGDFSILASKFNQSLPAPRQRAAPPAVPSAEYALGPLRPSWLSHTLREDVLDDQA